LTYPIPHYRFPAGRKHTFWVKLHALHIKSLVLQCHDKIVFVPRSHFKFLGETFIANYPTVITPNNEFIAETSKK
jgi:hypothetical protein